MLQSGAVSCASEGEHTVRETLELSFIYIGYVFLPRLARVVMKLIRVLAEIIQLRIALLRQDRRCGLRELFCF